MIEKLVHELTEKKLTISFMESASGGGLANAVTNVEGASEVLGFSAVTYSNEFKIKMGVPQEVILKYTVYSMETAVEMSKNIAKFANADFGVCITGKINREDPNNTVGDNSKIYVSIFEREKNNFSNFEIVANANLDREGNKRVVVNRITEKLSDLLGSEF